jgi:hypothetical protein
MTIRFSKLNNKTVVCSQKLCPKRLTYNSGREGWRYIYIYIHRIFRWCGIAFERNEFRRDEISSMRIKTY